ncbi:MAG: hypothetical protein QW035_03380 [Candidatus Anstonellales archaeon]
MDDELIIRDGNRGLGVRFNLEGKAEQEFCYAMAYAIPVFGSMAFDFSGIENKGAKSAEGLLELLKSKPSNPLLKEVQETAYIWNTLEAMGIRHLPKPEDYGFVQHEKVEAKDEIGLIVKYKGWISVKKVGTEAEDWERAFLAAGIVESIVRKLWEASGFKEAEVGRKDKKALAKAIEEAKGKEGLAGAYETYKAVREAGYSAYALEDFYFKYLYKEHPEIKDILSRKKRAKKKALKMVE